MVASAPIFIDSEVSKLPWKLAQDQLVTNSLWSNTDENLNVYMLAPDGTIYQKAVFNLGFYEIKNTPAEAMRTRINETINLMVMHKNCAIIQDTPVTSFTDLTEAQNRLVAKALSTNVRFTDCLSALPASLGEKVYYLQKNSTHDSEV